MLDGVAEPFELNANYYTETDKQAKTWTRYTVIDKSMVGKTYSVYNGSGFVPVTPTTENIGKKAHRPCHEGLTLLYFQRKGQIMIKYVTADMLDFSVDMPDMIIHQTNCEGRMGGGVAKSIKEKFPQVYVEYLEFIAHKRFVGENNLLGQVFETNVRIGDNVVKFVDVFAQNSCSENTSLYPDGRFTSYDALHDGLAAVMKSIVIPLWEKKKRPLNIWMPAKIGCVKGGGNLAIVTAIIKSVFDLTLYEDVFSLKLFEKPLSSGEDVNGDECLRKPLLNDN